MAKNYQKYAGFWIRVSSNIIDGLLTLVVLIFLLNIFFPLIHSNFSIKIYLFFSLFFLLLLPFLFGIYYIWGNAEGRHTLGKRIFGLEVVDKNEMPITLKVSFLRTLYTTLDLFALGYLFMIFSKNKQTFHDVLSRSYVLRKKDKTKKEIIVGILLLVLAVYIQELSSDYIRTNYIEAFHIPTGSMEPTILVGDYIFVDKYAKEDYIPESGDIIFFKYPLDRQITYVDRCIASGGQIIEIKDRKIYVDDVIFPDLGFTKHIDPQILPKGFQESIIFPSYPGDA